LKVYNQKCNPNTRNIFLAMVLSSISQFKESPCQTSYSVCVKEAACMIAKKSLTYIGTEGKPLLFSLFYACVVYHKH
jgi:hypothetical protein